MTDTASQNKEVKPTIQKLIDFYRSETGGFQRSFILRSVEGECKIESNTNIRFFTTKFSSFSNGGNNVFYFNDCTFSGTANNFIFKNCNLIFDKCKIETKLTFENCNIEFIENNITQTIELKTSILFSKKSSWNASDSSDNKYGVICSSKSKVESVLDSWSNWTEIFWQAKDRSFVKISQPKINNVKKTLANFQDKCTLQCFKLPELNITDTSETLFILKTTSKLDLHNFSKFYSDAQLFDCKDSKLSIRNGIELKSNKNSLGTFDNTIIEIINVPKLNAPGDNKTLISGTKTTINLSGNVALASSGSTIKLCGGKFSFIGPTNSTTSIISSKASALEVTGSCGGTSVFLKNIKTIKSESSTAITIDNCTLFIDTLDTLENKNQGSGIDGTSSIINLTNINAIKTIGDTGILIKNGSKLNYSNVKSLEHSGGSGIGISADNSSLILSDSPKISGVDAALKLENSSVAIIRNITDNLVGTAGSGILFGRACLLFGSNINTIKGSSGHGIYGSGKNGRVILKNIGAITGSSNDGVQLNDTDFLLDNSGSYNTGNVSTVIEGQSIGIRLINSVGAGSFTAKLIGPILVRSTGGATGFSGQRYKIEGFGVNISGKTSLQDCLVDLKYSKLDDETSLISGSASTFNTTIAKPRLSNNAFLSTIKTNLTDLNVDNSLIHSYFSDLQNSITSSDSELDVQFSKVGPIDLTTTSLKMSKTRGNSIQIDSDSSVFGLFNTGHNATNSSGDPNLTSSNILAGAALDLQFVNNLNVYGNNQITKLRNNHTETVQNAYSLSTSQGNITFNATSGNIVTVASAGEITLSAVTSIGAVVGSSSISIGTAAITVTATTVTI